MTPGTIICDSEYRFDDGTTKRKLLVILNDGSSGSYLVLKTTSKDKFKHRKYGCQLKDYHPNFYLPKGSCCLNGESWLLLTVHEFDLNHFLQRAISRRMEVIGNLTMDIHKELLGCLINSDDIEMKYEEVLIDTQNTLN